MGWWLAGAALLLAVTPIRLTGWVRLGQQVRWQTRVQVWGIALPEVSSDRPHRRPGRLRVRPAASKGNAALLWRGSRSARRFLARHLHPVHLAVDGRISTADAARTAGLTGALNALTPLLPCRWLELVCVRIRPDFTFAPTVFQLKGILRFRLGTLLIGVLLLAGGLLRQRLRHSKSKEAGSYGTSHR